MNFVAITQVTGGQSETLSTGLPTITFGPQQSIAQHQFPISNSLSSGATGGYQSNPLVSTTFQHAMLSPVSLRTLALLTSSHPREPVLYALIDSITLLDTKGDFIVRFQNDPTRPKTAAACERADNPASAADLQYVAANCNYDAYVRLLEALISAGLTAELIPEPQTSATGGKSARGGDGSDAASKEKGTQFVGHICFDPTRTVPGYRVGPLCRAYDYKAKNSRPNISGKASSTNTKDKTDKNSKATSKPESANATPTVTIYTSQIDPKTRRSKQIALGPFILSLSIRSPVGVYGFFGKLFSQDAGGSFKYNTGEVKNLIGPDEPFINITSDTSAGCYTSVRYESRTYCVPTAARNTTLMFTILQELRNLSIQSTDLNSAFTVRITN